MSEATTVTTTVSTTTMACLESFLPLFFLVGFGTALVLGGPLLGLLYLVTISIYFGFKRYRRRLGLLQANQRSPVASSDPVLLVLQQQQSSLAAKTPVDLSTLTLRTIKADEPVVIVIVMTCDICLEDMKEGEKVAASPNPECIHEFHAHCIVQALQRQTTCPCCRREYLLLPERNPVMDIEQQGVAVDDDNMEA
jgi:Ring finger domain